MAWTRIGSVHELANEDVVPVEVGEAKLAIFHCADAYYVTDNVCTHQYALLSDGFVEDACVECPLHEARFDLRTGKALCGPATRDIRVYPVRVDGEDILADV
jgi:3-phenylpropionate/trans-cinnamate dioxygenase ferredoxin subunit